jgi:hypothetical protein
MILILSNFMVGMVKVRGKNLILNGENLFKDIIN